MLSIEEIEKRLKKDSDIEQIVKDIMEEAKIEQHKNYLEMEKWLKENPSQYRNLPRKKKKEFKKMVDIVFPKEIR